MLAMSTQEHRVNGYGKVDREEIERMLREDREAIRIARAQAERRRQQAERARQAVRHARRLLRRAASA
jgi:predicted Zn-ribbon and HTH transcriptional regulator